MSCKVLLLSHWKGPSSRLSFPSFPSNLVGTHSSEIIQQMLPPLSSAPGDTPEFCYSLSTCTSKAELERRSFFVSLVKSLWWTWPPRVLVVFVFCFTSLSNNVFHFPNRKWLVRTSVVLHPGQCFFLRIILLKSFVKLTRWTALTSSWFDPIEDVDVQPVLKTSFKLCC